MKQFFEKALCKIGVHKDYSLANYKRADRELIITRNFYCCQRCLLAWEACHITTPAGTALHYSKREHLRVLVRKNAILFAEYMPMTEEQKALVATVIQRDWLRHKPIDHFEHYDVRERK